MSEEPEPSRNRATLVLVDHGLKSTRDSASTHSLAYATAFAEACEDFEIWSHESCDLGGRHMKPVFSKSREYASALSSRINKSGFRLFSRTITIALSNYHYFAALRRARDKKRKVFFILNASEFNVIAITIHASIRRNCKFILCFQKKPPGPVRIARYLRLVLRLHNIRYTMETANMARSYERLLGKKCDVVPFIVRAGTRQAGRISDQPPDSATGLIIGEPRLEKGFDLIAELIERLDGEGAEPGLQLVVQVSPVLDRSLVLGEAVSRIKAVARRVDWLRVFDGPLTEEEYDAAYARAQFLILPYRASEYTFRSSGIAFECRCAGKPMVLTRDVRESIPELKDGGLVLIRDGDAGSLCDGVREMVRTLKARTAEAQSLRAEFAERHSGRAIAESIFALAEAG